MAALNTAFLREARKLKKGFCLFILIGLSINVSYGHNPLGDIIDLRIKAKPDTIASFKSFTAKIYDEVCYLNWTVQDQAHDGIYCIERSFDGRNFQIIGVKEGIGVPITQPILYCFEDDSLSDVVLYYRIRHISEVNTLLTSNIIQVYMLFTEKKEQTASKEKNTVD